MSTTNFSNILESDMNERLQSSVESAKQQLKQAEHSFKVWTEAMAPKIEFFRANESEIINLLKEHKFAFDEKEPMRCSPVGDSEWRKHHDPTEHCSLHIDAPLKMKDRSPVSSENAQRRISWELEKAFEAKFSGKIVCSLNQYSLDRKNRILFELWVK
jgi:hypothetical protein